MRVNPSYLSSAGDGKEKVAGQFTDRHSVENVSWRDAVSFCNKLSVREKRLPCYVISGNSVKPVAGNGYRLSDPSQGV